MASLTGSTTAVFFVRLSTAVDEIVDVDWNTRDGTAIAGNDYEAASGTVSFLPGETEKAIDVIVYGQDDVSADGKKFYIELKPPANAVLTDALAECVITVADEDGVLVTSLVIAQGKRGLKGNPGLSAYEQAVLMGYTGTVEQWMDEIGDASQAAERAESFASQAAERAVIAGQKADEAAEAVISTKQYVDGALVSQSAYLDSELANQTQTVNSALSDLSTAANKFYPTLAAANADIANIQVDQPVTIGESANGGLWYKATSGATSLTKSAYDPLTQAKSYTDTELSIVSVKAPARKSNLIPVAVDAAGNVAIWIEDGKLSSTGLSDTLIGQVQLLFSSIVSSATLRNNTFIPIASDGAGSVALWIEDGKLAASGISQTLGDLIANTMATTFAKKDSVASLGKLTPYSNGKFLKLLRSKKALMQNNNAGQVKILLDGDSWIQLPAIPDALQSKISTLYGMSGVGFVSVIPISSVNMGVTWNVHTGFTTKDYAQQTQQPAPVYGCGIDGLALETSGTTGSLSLSLKTQTLRIFYWDGNGSFRYRVDGGAWTTVAGGGTNQKSNVLISGLSDAVHTFEIDTTVNTGTVSLHGFYATRTAKGAELSRCGNGDQSGRDASIFANQIPYFANIINPDVVVILLGTNEVRFNRSVASYVQGITDKVTAYRSVNPDVGIVIAFPAQCGSTGTIDESQYRDAGLKFAIENNCEWFSGFDLFDTYTKENALGMWNDPNHLNAAGATNFSNSLFKTFFGE